MSSSIDREKFNKAILMRKSGQWQLAVLFLKAAYGVK